MLGKYSTCFRQTYCPSSRVLLLYSQQFVFVKFFKDQQAKQTKHAYQNKNTKEKQYKSIAVIRHKKYAEKTASNLTNASFCVKTADNGQ